MMSIRFLDDGDGDVTFLNKWTISSLSAVLDFYSKNCSSELIHAFIFCTVVFILTIEEHSEDTPVYKTYT